MAKAKTQGKTKARPTPDAVPGAKAMGPARAPETAARAKQPEAARQATPGPTARPTAKDLARPAGNGTAPRARRMRALQRAVGNTKSGRMAEGALPAPADPQVTRAVDETAARAPADPNPPQYRRKALKMAVSSPSEPAEVEAREVAAKVAAGENAPPITQRADEEPIQREVARAGGAGVGSAAAERAMAASGAGEAIAPEVRGVLESRMSTDLSEARIHKDTAANQAAESLNARAFATGNDIYMARGESDRDVGLMAHEATHLVQQGKGAARGSFARARAYRDNGETGATPPQAGSSAGAAASASRFDSPKKSGTIDKDAKQITIPLIKLPKFKKTDETTPPLTIRPKVVEADTGEIKKRSTKQIPIWESAAQEGTELEDKLDKKVARGPKLHASDGERVYFLKMKKANTYVIGKKPEVKKRIARPYWDKRGRLKSYHVDHIKEYQLYGADDITNMWLLNAAANMESGRKIKDQIRSRTMGLAEEASGTLWSKPPSLTELKRDYKITFQDISWTLPMANNVKDRYTLEDIKSKGSQLRGLDVMTKREIEATGLQGSPDKLTIFTNPTGGAVKRIPWTPGGPNEQPVAKQNFVPGFDLQKVRYKRGEGGKLIGALFPKSSHIQVASVLWDFEEKEAIEYGGYISQTSLKRSIASTLKAAGFSPIEIVEAEMQGAAGLYGSGRIVSDLPLLEGVAIDLRIRGKEVEAYKTFDTGDFKFPGPIDVTGSSLTVVAGSAGFGLEGDMTFEIERVGKGKISGRAATGSGVELAGSFDFDTELFNPARVSVCYKDGKFSGAGALGIKEGTVRGIKSATATATFAGDRISAEGTVVPDIPGVESGTFNLSYSEAEGLAVGGSLAFGEGMPGIKSGSIEASVIQRPEGKGYKVSATGTAVPDIPGVGVTLTASYDDGAFTVEGSGDYERGMAKGRISVGVTNRTVGEDGQPSGEPGPELTAYGTGEVTITFTPWLQGTVGLRLLPNGEIEVSGEVALPSSLDVFPEKRYDKRLLEIGIDIPIFGFAAAGYRIGIFANVSGGIDLYAGIGPGQLKDVAVGITYNPAHEEETEIRGSAKFVVPADAGIRLFISGSVGAGLAIVSIRGGIEVGGGLGIEGAAEAGVTVNWTPATGLVLDAYGELYAEPKLKFDIGLFVKADLDLWLTSIELIDKRWALAAFEFGSGLRFGVRFPVHYEEGKPFELSLDDIQFEVPRIEPMSMIKNLVDEIT